MKQEPTKELKEALARELFSKDWRSIITEEDFQKESIQILSILKSHKMVFEADDQTFPENFYVWCRQLRNGQIDGTQLFKYISDAGFVRVAQIQDNQMSRREFLGLPVEERRKILQQEAQKLADMEYDSQAKKDLGMMG